MLRRRKLPTELEDSVRALRAVVDHIEAAKDAMTSTVPSTRSGGTPLAEGILELEQRLGSAQALMPAWRHPDLEAEWLACDAGIRESLERARRLREDPPELGGFEGLIWAVDQILAPLEAFEAAAERFRSLRR
jgi:phenylpropionate dioxygenase-like ring-hydroxylating dioxygenase large terminal subunit